MITVFLFVQNNFELHILRQVIFNVTSILTGTGFTSTSYDQWGTPAIIVFLAITFIGGCAGSTTCGLKVFRLQVILKNSGQVMNKLISPNRVTNHKYNGENLTLDIVGSVMTFLFFIFRNFRNYFISSFFIRSRYFNICFCSCYIDIKCWTRLREFNWSSIQF